MPINFDIVNYSNLNGTYIIEKSVIHDQELYSGKAVRYLTELIDLLNKLGLKIIKSRYAKSVESWIYLDSDCITNHIIDIKDMEKRIGRVVPCYHIFDVLTLLRKKANPNKEYQPIHPVNNRISFAKISNIPFDKGFAMGYPLFEKAEILAKNKNFIEALSLLDKAREYGYLVPALYSRYAKIYRSLKDYDNEIDINEEQLKTASPKPQFVQRLAKAKKLWRENS